MKKTNLILFLVIGIIGLTGWVMYFLATQTSGTDAQVKTAQDQGFSTVWGKQEIIIGLDDAYPPIGFRDDQGQLTGFDIDLAKAAFAKIGLTPIFKPVAWDGVILTLLNREIDVVWNGMTITDSRKQQIAFSEGYLNGEDDFVVRSDSGIKSSADLAGKVVGIQTGSSQEQELKSTSLASQVTIRGFASNDEAFLDLKSGRLDALMIDNFVGGYYISNINKEKNVYSMFAGGFGNNQTGVGIRKEDTALKAAIDQALSNLKADGTAVAISNKWFGTDLIAY